MELLEADFGDVDPLQTLQDVRLVSCGVGAKAQVVVAVVAPHISLQWSSGFIGEMQGSVQHRVVQDRETVMIQESCVSALLYEVDYRKYNSMHHQQLQFRLESLILHHQLFFY